MEEQLLSYLIVLFFFFYCYKGYKNGASYEMTSIIFFLIAAALSLIIYSESLITKVIATILFFGVYFLGLFISFLIKKKTLAEKILGVFIGGFKYLIYLVFMDVLTMMTNSNVLVYDENLYIRTIHPISEYFKNQIETYIL